MIVKKRDEQHFIREFPGMKTLSRRVILPGPDLARVKATDVLGIMGERFDDVRNDTDETVVIISGQVRIHQGENEYDLVGPCVYYVPAGEVYSVEFIKNTRAFCVFSQAENGTLPYNEEIPDKPGLYR